MKFNRIFYDFQSEYLIMSKKYNANSYDILISSSDQIWNREFLLLIQKKLVIPHVQVNQNKLMNYFEEEIPMFSNISVSKNFIETKTSIKNVFVSCDPTLLIDFESYNIEFKEYILIYSLNMSLE